MNSDARFPRLFILIVDYILPLPLTALMYALWFARTGEAWFSAYTLALGIAFGYILPGIGTNLLGLWEFNGPLRIGRYCVHHGFMYAPYFSLTLYVCYGAGGDLGAAGVIAVIVACALVQGFLSTLHDLQGLRSGFIRIYSRKSREGAAPEAVALDYGPVGFSLCAGAYAFSCIMARRLLAKSQVGTLPSFLLLTAIGVFLMGATTVPYLIKERESIGSAWRKEVRDGR
jgi:hypothetical protein